MAGPGQIRADVILADYVDTAGGKAAIIGGGWSVRIGVGPMAVVIFLEVPWDLTNQKMAFVLELLDQDGNVVLLPGPTGAQPFHLAGGVEAGRPPGLPHGTPMALPPVGINIGPLPLGEGRYVFRFSLDGHTEETWQRSFTVMSAPAA